METWKIQKDCEQVLYKVGSWAETQTDSINMYSKVVSLVGSQARPQQRKG